MVTRSEATRTDTRSSRRADPVISALRSGRARCRGRGACGSRGPGGGGEVVVGPGASREAVVTGPGPPGVGERWIQGLPVR